MIQSPSGYVLVMQVDTTGSELSGGEPVGADRMATSALVPAGRNDVLNRSG
jgi:hypothetical protein